MVTVSASDEEFPISNGASLEITGGGPGLSETVNSAILAQRVREMGKEKYSEMAALAPNLKMSLRYIAAEDALAKVQQDGGGPSTGGKNFRNKRQVSSHNYADIMLKDLWMIGPPLIEDENGVLIDGQNRLWAVVESGKGQWFLVISGVPNKSAVAFDNGAPRTKTEVLRFLFRDHPWIMDLFSNAPLGTVSAILVAINGGLKDSYIANSALLNAVFQHKSALAFVVETFFPEKNGKRRKAKGITRAHSAGVFGRAFIKYKDNPKKLARIRHVATKLVGGIDTALEPDLGGLLKLRGFLENAQGLSGSMANTIVYQKVAKCLVQAIEDKNTTFVLPKQFKNDKGKMVYNIDREFIDPFEIVVSTESMEAPINMIREKKKGKKGKKAA